MQTIWDQNKLPILVGGSGFYLKSIFFPPSYLIHLSDNPFDTVHSELVEERAIRLRQGYAGQDGIGKKIEWDELNQIDPIRAAAIGKQDRYRIGRALDIWYTTGIKPSEHTAVYQAPASFSLIFLTRSRQELYTRINDRVDMMMRHGWLAEVEVLYQTDWETFLFKKKLIGYNELLQYLHDIKNDVGEHETAEEKLRATIDTIKQRTRHYAKRQHTFWRMLKKMLEHELTDKRVSNTRSSIEEINLTLLNLDLYITLLSDRLLKIIER
jgi:tRNA dimethylallyltransferase